jgi:hypothetical protein
MRSNQQIAKYSDQATCLVLHYEAAYSAPPLVRIPRLASRDFAAEVASEQKSLRMELGLRIIFSVMSILVKRSIAITQFLRWWYRRSHVTTFLLASFAPGIITVL